jgi:hypothetical protein
MTRRLAVAGLSLAMLVCSECLGPVSDVGLNVGVSPAENPTLTIVPIQGKQFTERVLTPLEDAKLEFLVYQGSPIDMVMRLMADGIEMQTREGAFARFILNWPTHPSEYEEFRQIAMQLAWLNATRRLFVGRLSFLETTHARLSTPPTAAEDRRDIVPTISVDVSRWQLWVDPMVGSRFTVDLYKHFQLLIGGDIGGFGVGSHFTYSILGLLGYRFQMLGHAAIAHAGYRTLSQNYATRTVGDLFKWDMIMHGPILGLTIRF